MEYSVATFRFIAYELREIGRVSAVSRSAAVAAAERAWPGRVVHVQSEASAAVAREEFGAVMRRIGQRLDPSLDDQDEDP